MSRSRRMVVEKKLHDAKKAFKRFSRKLQSKFHKFNISATAKAATRRLRSTLQRSFSLLIPSKLRRRLLLRSGSSFSPNYYYRDHEDTKYFQEYKYNNHRQYQYQNNFAAIHIDELFGDQSASSSTIKNNDFRDENREMRKGKKVIEEQEQKVASASEPEEEIKIIHSIEDAWNVVVASSPHLRPVDERAEEFIRKFREDIVLQKEKSLIEFQEKMARSR